MQLIIRSQEGDNVAYDILDEQGLVVRSIQRDVSAERAQARASHRSLADVLADSEAAEVMPQPVAKAASVKPAPQPVAPAPIGMEVEQEPAVAPHSHELQEHEHPHTHDDILGSLSRHWDAVAGVRDLVAEARSGLLESIETHTHPDHDHSELTTQLAAHARMIKNASEHSHPHSHELVEHTHPDHEHPYAVKDHSHDAFALQNHSHSDIPVHGHGATDLRLEELESIADKWRGWEVADAAPHEHNYAPATHEHEVTPHRHASLEGLKDELATLGERVTQHGHPHDHADSAERTARLEKRLEEVANRPLQTHDHALPLHSHELEAHTHSPLESAIGVLRQEVEQHGHPHEHEGVATAAFVQSLIGRVDALAATIDGLKRELAAHSHPAASHIHEPVAHDHPELKLVLSDHIEAVARRATWRVLSEQEVGGNTRLVVEEVK